MARLSFRSVDEAFRDAVEQGVFPGAAVLAAKGGRIVLENAYGFRSSLDSQRMQTGDVFDVASLTKPLATTTALMVLVGERKVALDDPVSKFVPAGVSPQTRKVSLRQLLAHTSGLPAWRPYYQEVMAMEKAGIKGFVRSHDAKKYVLERVLNEQLVSLPGTQGVYSDLGFILLGAIVELVGGCALDQYCGQKIFDPLGLESTFFVDLSADRLSRRPGTIFVPTQKCPWRKEVLRGEVDDDNAYAMGGVAGHAGLFSSLHDVHKFLVCLRDSYLGKDGFLQAQVVREFLARDKAVEGWTRALGWDTPSAEGSSSGKYFSPTAVGHLGFTGTSIWWDLEQDCHVILLSNRVHPTRSNDKIRGFRPDIHDLIMERLLR